MRPGNVLIAGAGFVGRELAGHLAGQGRRVLALRRTAAEPQRGVETCLADLTRPETLSMLGPDFDAVVYLASAGARSESAYRGAYVDGLDHLLAQLGAGWSGRLLFASSTAVYAQRDGSQVDERSPTEPEHFSGRILLEGEALARAHAGVVVRFGGIYGPGRRQLLDRVLAGEARYALGEPRYTNRVHRADASGALAHLLDLADPAPVYVGVDEAPAPEREVLEWLAMQLGAPPPQPGPSDPQSRRGRANRRCSSALLRGSGYAFAYPSYREGYAEMLEPRQR